MLKLITEAFALNSLIDFFVTKKQHTNTYQLEEFIRHEFKYDPKEYAAEQLSQRCYS